MIITTLDELSVHSVAMDKSHLGSLKLSGLSGLLYMMNKLSTLFVFCSKCHEIKFHQLIWILIIHKIFIQIYG